MKNKLTLCIPILLHLAALSGQDRTRGLQNTELLRQQRPAAVQRQHKAAAPSPNGADLIGITLWRLRSVAKGDRRRILLHESDDEEQLTQERIPSSTLLRPNDRVRLSIESARRGYLYVASRERYADGSLGDAHLIYPSRRINGGRNEVEPGQIVDIPDAGNKKPFLVLKRSRDDQTAEVILVVVAPAPIPGLIVDGPPPRLSRDQIAGWMSKPAERYEMPVQATSSAWTAKEKAAAQGISRLTPEDATPQTVARPQRTAGGLLVLDYTLGLAKD